MHGSYKNHKRGERGEGEKEAGIQIGTGENPYFIEKLLGQGT